MSLSLAQFITKYDGKRVGSGQCVALVRRWIENIGGIMPTVVSAEDMWTAASTAHWEKHGRASGYVPKRNAIAVWKGHPGNEHGHVAITRDDSDAHYVNTFDQNYSRSLRCARERHRVDATLIGYLVRKP